MLDTICACNHWFEEHDSKGCFAPNCNCSKFQFDETLNTPQAILDRGGQHHKWCVCAACECCGDSGNLWN